MWAVLMDQRFRGADSIVVSQLTYFEDPHLLRWLRGILNTKGLIGPLLALPLSLATHALPLAPRLLCALAHGVLMVQIFDIARRITGRAQAGLWAAGIAAASPVIFGVCRLSYHDVLVAVAVCATLQLVLWARVDRWSHLVALGATIGIGLLTKLSYAMYVVGPLLWFAARHLRSMRALVRLSIIPVVAGAVLVAPYSLAWHVAVAHMEAGFVAGNKMPLAEKAAYYLRLPGVFPLLALAGIGLATLALDRHLDRWRWLLLATAVPMLAALYVSDAWSRFLLPAMPLLAVINGVTLDWWAGELPRALQRVVAGAAALAVVLFVSSVTLGHVMRPDPAEERELEFGMTTPDRRPYHGFPEAVEVARRFGPDAQLVFDSVGCWHYMHQVPRLWAFRGFDMRWLQPKVARRRIRQDRTLTVVLLRQQTQAPLHQWVRPQVVVRPQEEAESVEELWRRPTDESLWLQHETQLCLVARSGDADGMEYWVLRATQGPCPAGLPRLPPHERLRPLPPP